MDFFRQEVMESRDHFGNGVVIIPASLNMNLYCGMAIVLLVCIITFLIVGEFTRKARLSGVVMPSSGLIKISPPYPGFVTELFASEGAHVLAGDSLYHISGERFTARGEGTLAAIKASLQTQYAMLEMQQAQEMNGNLLQQDALKQRIQALQPQLNSASLRLNLAQQQAELATSVMSRYQKLVADHYVSAVEFQQKQIESSSSLGNVENERQLLLQLTTSLTSTKNELTQLIKQGESRKTELDRQLQALRQQQIELTGQENITLTAPKPGIVSAVLAKPGQSVLAHETLLTLLPDNAHLQIEVYATSKDVGFIRPGQSVGLRFAAFPYQKFGVQRGVIREINRTTLTPADLSMVAPGIGKVNEGHYRVIIEPAHSYILAYGNKESLRPGMALEADVSLDTRRLWEWLTEPLWSLKGTL